jgi:hypothetical protein
MVCVYICVCVWRESRLSSPLWSVGLWISVQFLLAVHFVLPIRGKGLLRHVQYVPLHDSKAYYIKCR